MACPLVLSSAALHKPPVTHDPVSGLLPPRSQCLPQGRCERQSPGDKGLHRGPSSLLLVQPSRHPANR